MADYHQYKRKKPLIEILNANGIRFTTRTTIQQMKDLIDAHMASRQQSADSGAKNSVPPSNTPNDTESEKKKQQEQKDKKAEKRRQEKQDKLNAARMMWAKANNCPFYVDSFIVETNNTETGYTVPSHVLFVLMKDTKFWVEHDIYEEKEYKSTVVLNAIDGAKMRDYIKNIYAIVDKMVISLTNKTKLLSTLNQYRLLIHSTDVD